MPRAGTGAPGTFRVGTDPPATCRDEAAPQLGYITDQSGTGPQAAR